MSYRTISIEEVRPGMHVHKVYTSDPSIDYSFKDFQTKSEDDVQKLKKACIKKLIIDTDKQFDPINKIQPEIKKLQEIESGVTLPLGEEIANAKLVIAQAKKTLDDFAESITKNKPIEIKGLKCVIGKTLDSIKRNNQAMLALLHINRHGSFLMSHSMSVMSLATAIGHKCQLTEKEIENLALASLLHDIGWIRMPVYLISKGRPYANTEKALVKKASEYSLDILEKVGGLSSKVLNTVSELSEIKIEDTEQNKDIIPKTGLSYLSQILAVTDFYDKLVHGIMGTTGRTPSAALKHLYKIYSDAGIKESILIHLVKVLGVYPITSAVLLDTGEKGIVLELNKESPLLPKIKICYNSDKKPLSSPTVLDLSNQHQTRKSKIASILDPFQTDNDPYGLLKCTESSFELI